MRCQFCGGTLMVVTRPDAASPTGFKHAAACVGVRDRNGPAASCGWGTEWIRDDPLAALRHAAATIGIAAD